MSRALRTVGFAAGLTVASWVQAGPVFINEIHYDNAGIDTGEAIEIAGPAGTDLTGWSIVRYNGATQQVYSTPAATETLSGTIPNQQNGFGTVVINYPSNGLQNGAPDGIALLDNTSAVVQFLSYEGSFMALNGPATGMTSTDIGVTEVSSTAIGDSLRLSGTGRQYSSFTWQSAAPSTFGAVNTGQTFLAGLGSVVINEVLASHTGTDNTEFIELYGLPGTALAGLSLIVVEGDNIASQGAIDRRIDFGSTDVLGGNGFFLIGNPVGLASNYGVTPDRTVGDNALENNSLTIALVETSSLSGTTATGLEIILDAIALTDGGAGDLAYFGAPVLGPDGSFFPAGARRIVNGVDTDSVADWTFADFNLGLSNTPTAAADVRVVPEPATLALLGLGLAGLGAFRRKRS